CVVCVLCVCNLPPADLQGKINTAIRREKGERGGERRREEGERKRDKCIIQEDKYERGSRELRSQFCPDLTLTLSLSLSLSFSLSLSLSCTLILCLFSLSLSLSCTLILCLFSLSYAFSNSFTI